MNVIGFAEATNRPGSKEPLEPFLGIERIVAGGVAADAVGTEAGRAFGRRRARAALGPYWRAPLRGGVPVFVGVTVGVLVGVFVGVE